MNELNTSNFDSSIKSGTWIVDFWAPWCGPCRMMGPVFESVSKKMSNLKFAKLNAEQSQEVAAKAGVVSIPCFIIYKNGVEAGRIIGAMGEESFQKKISQYV